MIHKRPFGKNTDIRFRLSQ